jgi:hypothetical protein
MGQYNMKHKGSYLIGSHILRFKVIKFSGSVQQETQGSKQEIQSDKFYFHHINRCFLPYTLSSMCHSHSSF